MEGVRCGTALRILGKQAVIFEGRTAVRSLWRENTAAWTTGDGAWLRGIDVVWRWAAVEAASERLGAPYVTDDRWRHWRYSGVAWWRGTRKQ